MDDFSASLSDRFVGAPQSTVVSLAAVMVCLSSISLALPFTCLASASVISLPAVFPPNGTALNIPVRQVHQYKPISPLPPDPSGFTIHYVWTPSRALNPLGVYVTAIKLMYGLTQQTYDSPVDLIDSGLCIVSDQPEYNIIIFTRDETLDAGLTTGHVVRVLYEAMTAMATRQPGFLKVMATIQLKEKEIGKMYIDHSDLSMSNDEDAPGVTPVLDSPQSNQSSIGATTHPTNSTPLLGTNAFVDPHDSRFKITWQWDGKNIPAQDVFSAAFNGLAAMAPYQAEDPSEFMTAVSTSGNAVLHIGQSTRTTLYGGSITRAFYLLIQRLFLREKRFQEMWFQLTFGGFEIADGYLYKVVRAGGEGRAEGVASE